MSIAKRIKTKRLEFGLTQSKLANLAGITQQSLQKIEDGRTQNPRKLFNLAKALDCSAEWLQFGDNVKENSPHYLQEHLRPLIEAEKVTDWLASAHLDTTISKTTSWYNVPDTTSKKAFWLKVIGDSMNSYAGLSIPEGYSILVEPERQAKNGDLVVVRFNNTHEITFKKLHFDSGRTYLRALNPSYSHIDVTGKATVLGVVKEAKLVL